MRQIFTFLIIASLSFASGSVLAGEPKEPSGGGSEPKVDTTTTITQQSTPFGASTIESATLTRNETITLSDGTTITTHVEATYTTGGAFLPSGEARVTIEIRGPTSVREFIRESDGTGGTGGAGGTGPGVPGASPGLGGPAPTPPTLTFSAAPSAIGRGGTSLLTWTSDAVSCIGDCRNPGLCDDWDPNTLLDAGTYKQPTGSQTVKPSQTATYRLTCFGSGSPPASTYKDVTVSVSTFKFREIIPRLFPFIQKVFGYSQ